MSGDSTNVSWHPMEQTLRIVDGFVSQRAIVGDAQVEIQYNARQARALAVLLVKMARRLERP